MEQLLREAQIDSDKKELSVTSIDNLKQYLSQSKISNNHIRCIEPFVINLDDCKKIIITKLLRVVPHRRMVFAGELITEQGDKQKCVCKLFINNDKFAKDYQRQLQGYKFLINANIQTANLIEHQLIENEKISYCLYEYIEQVQDVHILSDYGLSAVIKHLALMHDAKLIQTDLHFDNFVLNKTGVYTLDLGSLQSLTKYNNEQIYDNFALFLAQLPISHHQKWDEYIDYYLKQLAILSPDAITNGTIKSTISKKSKKSLRERLNNYLTKAQRNCSEFAQVKFSDGCYILQGMVNRQLVSEKYHDFFNELVQTVNPERLLINNTERVLKDGGTAKVLLISYKETRFVVKHYFASQNRLKIIVDNIKYIFTLPRALNSWLYGNLLEHIGIKTAKPIAMLFKRSNGLVLDSYFIMEYKQNMTRCAELFDQENFINNKLNMKNYSQQILGLLADLNFINFVHNDFKDVNIGFSNDEIVVFDLDAISDYNSGIFSKLRFKLKAQKDFNRIMKSFKSKPEIKQCLTNLRSKVVADGKY